MVLGLKPGSASCKVDTILWFPTPWSCKTLQWDQFSGELVHGLVSHPALEARPVLITEEFKTFESSWNLETPSAMSWKSLCCPEGLLLSMRSFPVVAIIQVTGIPAPNECVSSSAAKTKGLALRNAS